MKNLLLLLVLIIIAASCNHVEYESDVAFMNSSDANSFEFPVYINNKMCVDLNRNPGLCVLHHNKSNTLTLTVDPRPYTYKLDLFCPEQNVMDGWTVPKGKKFTHSFDRGDLLASRSMVCIGEIFPRNRGLVSAKFSFVVKLVDSEYIKRNKIMAFPNEGLLVIGNHALYTTENRLTKRKRTTLKLKKNQKVYSESHNMRFNAYGY